MNKTYSKQLNHLINEYDPEELSWSISAFFMSGRGLENYNAMRYSLLASPDEYVDVYFNKNNTPENFEVSDHFKEETFQKLLATIHDELTIGEEYVANAVGYSAHPVKGWYRYKNEFQIYGLDDSFPQGDNTNLYPFLFQFKCNLSSNPFIREHRKNKKQLEYHNNLHLLLIGTFDVLPVDQIHTRTWVVNFKTGKSDLGHKGYMLDRLVFVKDDEGFQNVNGLQLIARKPYADYYLQDEYSDHSLFVLPDNLELSLDKISKLKTEQKKIFDRALYWFGLYKSLREVSLSATQIALVTSIEALLDKSSELCDVCKQPKYSITKRYNSFIKKYVYGNDVPSSHKRMVNGLYPRRSSLTHGNKVLDADERAYFIFLRASEEKASYSSYLLTRIALYNWLNSHN